MSLPDELEKSKFREEDALKPQLGKKQTTFVEENAIGVVYGYGSGEFGKEGPQVKPNVADTPKSLQIKVNFDEQIHIACEECGATACS